MLTENRWQKEQELMQSVFPQFIPFSNHSGFGFAGHLRGVRSGQLYRVALEADPLTYPQCPPDVRMTPRIGDHWVDHRGRRTLCVVRDWQPARSTFANTVLAVLRYLDEYDGVSSSAPRHSRGIQARRLDQDV